MMEYWNNASLLSRPSPKPEQQFYLLFNHVIFEIIKKLEMY